MQALSIHAGPRALQALRAHGLQPEHVRAIPAAAGGPKGLVLNALDQFIFGEWLTRSTATVHLLGASIGAHTAALNAGIVPSPNLEWIATLPNAKLPDRGDFKFFGDDVAGRVATWSRALKESERLRDEFAAWVGGRTHIEVKPLV